MSDIREISQQAIDEIVSRGLIQRLGAIAAGERMVLKWNIGLQKEEPMAYPSVKDQVAAAGLLKQLACEDSANAALKEVARTFLVRPNEPTRLEVAE